MASKNLALPPFISPWLCLGLWASLWTVAAQAQGTEAWGCSTEVVDRSGHVDFSRCQNERNQWACYEEIQETCDDWSSGRATTRLYRHYTGVCGSSPGACL